MSILLHQNLSCIIHIPSLLYRKRNLFALLIMSFVFLELERIIGLSIIFLWKMHFIRKSLIRNGRSAEWAIVNDHFLFKVSSFIIFCPKMFSSFTFGGKMSIMEILDTVNVVEGLSSNLFTFASDLLHQCLDQLRELVEESSSSPF